MATGKREIACYMADVGRVSAICILNVVAASQLTPQSIISFLSKREKEKSEMSVTFSFPEGNQTFF